MTATSSGTADKAYFIGNSSLLGSFAKQFTEVIIPPIPEPTPEEPFTPDPPQVNVGGDNCYEDFFAGDAATNPRTLVVCKQSAGNKWDYVTHAYTIIGSAKKRNNIAGILCRPDVTSLLLDVAGNKCNKDEVWQYNLTTGQLTGRAIHDNYPTQSRVLYSAKWLNGILQKSICYDSGIYVDCPLR